MLGAFCYLRKPVELDALLEAMTALGYNVIRHARSRVIQRPPLPGASR